jgi:Amt family ammonium transporter
VEDTGKVASRAAVTTTVGAGAGAISALIAKLYLEERRTGETNFSALAALNGALSGAVCITPGSGVLEPWAAVLMGALAGIAYLGGSELLIRLRIDDAVDAIPVHLCNGVLGILGVGFLASPRALLDAYNDDSHAGFFYELGRGSWDASLLACQVIAILFVFGWVFVTMFPFFIWLNYMGWLRSDSLEELVGLDISYHGGSAINTEQVKAEYLDVYNKNKSNIRRRGRTLEENRHPVDVSFGNRYDDERGESVLEEAAGIE